MGSDTCGECGDEFVWDSDAGSAVCLACGTLQDPSQVVLDVHLDKEDKAQDHYGNTFSTRSTLGFRNLYGWSLAGQGKLAATERNKNVMRQYIMDLARKLGHQGLSSRTQLLFEQAMERGGFHFGRKARLVAGASLAIALREAHKGETIKDIAYLLGESPVALARVLTTVVGHLDIRLTEVDPSWHLPVLQKQFVEILAEQTPSPSLPRNLIRSLKEIHLPSVLRTASSLSELVSRAGFLTNGPAPPIACAIFILSLESEVLSPLPHCGELARVLGGRLGVSKDVAMRRYKAIYEQVEEWAAEIPWMGESVKSVGKRSSSKVGKRGVVARCLKDTVQFQEGKWRSHLRASEPLGAPDEDDEFVSASEISSSSEVDLQRNVEESSRTRKRRKTSHVDDVSQFLLSPLYSGPASKATETHMASSLDIATHILTSESPSFIRLPTRLELLSTHKPAEEITDEELFATGELEGFLRSEGEQETLIQTCEWLRGGDDATDSEEAHTIRARDRDRERGGTSRVNIEALNRLLEDAEADNWVEATFKDDGDWVMSGVPKQLMTFDDGLGDEARKGVPDGVDLDLQVESFTDKGEDEAVEPWRPLSPGVRMCWDDTARYEEA